MCLMSHCMWIFSQVTLLVMSEHSLLSEITLWIRADEIDGLEEQRFSLKNRMLCMQVSSHYTGMMRVKNPHTANRSDTTIRTTATTSSVRKKYQIRLLSPLSGSDFSPFPSEKKVSLWRCQLSQGHPEQRRFSPLCISSSHPSLSHSDSPYHENPLVCFFPCPFSFSNSLFWHSHAGRGRLK